MSLVGLTSTKPEKRRGLAGSASVFRLPSTRIAIFILVVVAVMVAFGSTLAPHGSLTQNINDINQAPSLHHLFGTDYLGRDVLSRMMVGTRLSILSALEAVGLGLGLGTIPGVAAVFLGRWFDYAANRIADALMTLPSVIFAISVTAILGNGLVQAMFPIGILLAPSFFRVTRSVTLEYAQAQYVEAAELLGASKGWVIRRHVLRKVFPTIAVTTATVTAAALLTVSFLTFLGIGVEPPTPTWGGILSSDLNYLAQNPWAPFLPGAVIAITVGAVNALADALRDHRPAYQLLTPAGAMPLVVTSEEGSSLEHRPSAA
jgi:peptide/nickel transport system permease protein